MRGIHRWPVNSPHKRPVTRKMFPFDDVIMYMKLSMIPSEFLWLSVVSGVVSLTLCEFSKIIAWKYTMPEIRNQIYDENVKLKLCTCSQSMALDTRAKFQLEILIRSTISPIHKFRENFMESSWNVGDPRDILVIGCHLPVETYVVPWLK